MEVSSYSPHHPPFARRDRFPLSDVHAGYSSPSFYPLFSPLMMSDATRSMSPSAQMPSNYHKRSSLSPIQSNSMINSYQDGFANEAFQQLNLNESVDSNITDVTTGTSRSDPRQPANSRCTLPPWTMDPDRRAVIYSMEQVVKEELLEAFAKDKIGCQFLQENFPKVEGELRSAMYRSVMRREGLFLTMSRDVFANFFAQLLIEQSNALEQRWIAKELTNQMNGMCMNRYSCRVVQKALEVLSNDLKSILMYELHTADCVHLSIDQNANHVIQKIMSSFPVMHWSFVLESFLRTNEGFFEVAESKYGCRVMQLAIETLTSEQHSDHQFSPGKMELLERLLNRVVDHCERLAANEYSNYVVQHILSTPALAEFRDKIIEVCLLRNLLSFAQEKFASHVVEKALTYASPELLKEMMEELFDGYVPDPETKKDCLDILLFHQFGNYVVQRMLTICLDSLRKAANHEEFPYSEMHKKWAVRLESRITNNASRLKRYSSGKKILDTLWKSLPPPTPARFSF